MEYTKGEWKIIVWNDKRGFNVFTDEEFVASVSNDRGPANAHLIAAAPDMYSALQLWTRHNQGTRGHYCSECATAIEKALAKAEGR